EKAGPETGWGFSGTGDVTIPSTIKEMATAEDIEPMLRKIGAHPGGQSEQIPTVGEELHQRLTTNQETNEAAAEAFRRQQERDYNKYYSPGGRFNPKFAAEDRVSTRVPSAVKATENPLEGEPLTIDRAAVDAAPGLAQKMADRVRGYDGLKVPKNIKDPSKVLDRFQGHVEDNLRWIYNQVEPEVADQNKKWYESANQIARDISETHGMEPRQGAG